MDSALLGLGSARRLSSAAAVIGVLCALQLPDAAAAGTDSPVQGKRVNSLATVLGPDQGGLLAGARARVSVRLRPGLRSFQAWLDRKDVTREFRQLGNSRVALLRAKLGVNRLYVRVRDPRGRRDFDYVRFVRASRRGSLLQLGSLRARARGGHVPVRVLLRGKGLRLRAFLNGRRLRSKGSGRVRRFVLDGDAGLHFGRNRIRLEAFSERGVYDVERRSVRVGRDHPIPAAGGNRRVKVRQLVRLDGRRSLAAKRSHTLGYRWRIVRRPKGSRATLRDAATALPSLRPDRPGNYLIRLALSEPGGRSLDRLTVAAGPNLPPIGVRFDTIAGAGGGARLGPPYNINYASNNAVQLLALDRTDLSLVTFKSYAPDVAGMQALSSEVSNLSSNDLVTISSPPGKTSSIQVVDPSAVSFLNQALSIIGAPSPVQGDQANPPPQGFSAIGVPGEPCCGAPINAGISPAGSDGVVHVNGDLGGYLQLDNTGHFNFVSPDYIPFNTAAQGTTSSQAVVTVGSETYTSTALPGGQAGFFLLLLDAGSLQLVKQDTQAVSGGGLPAFAAANGLLNLTQDITSAYNDPTKLLIIQSIGQVQRGDDTSSGLNTAWDDFANAQGQIGGNALYLNAVSPDSYSYVGPAQSSQGTSSEWSATSSTAATGGSNAGQLSGLLTRNPFAQYYPKLAGTIPTAAASMPAVAFQPPTPWEDRDTPANKQAIACIAAILGLTMPIEGNYTNSGIDFDAKSDDLILVNATKLPALPQCSSGFGADDFNAVRTQLVTEFGDVSTVEKLMGQLQKPLVADAATVQANLADITQAIDNTINPPNSQTQGNPEALISNFFYLGSAIPGTPGALFSLEGATMGLAAQMTVNSDGSNEMAQNFTAQADSVGDILAQRYADAYQNFDSITDLLVSDWGKLQTAAQNTAGVWAWTSLATNQASDVIKASTQQFVYEALFPLQYTLYRFGDQQLSDAGEYKCFGAPLTVGDFFPFANSPDGGNAVVTQAGPTTDLWAFGQINDQFLQQNANVRGSAVGPPPQSLWNSMFASPVSTLLNAPPLPSQLRFMIDVYGSPQHVITRDDSDECLLDGNLPP